MGSYMAKKKREQSTVSKVHGMKKPMRRSERVGEAPPFRYDYDIRLDCDPSKARSRNILESFQNILLLTNRSNLPSRTF